MYDDIVDLNHILSTIGIRILMSVARATESYARRRCTLRWPPAFVEDAGRLRAVLLEEAGRLRSVRTPYGRRFKSTLVLRTLLVTTRGTNLTSEDMMKFAALPSNSCSLNGAVRPVL